MTRSGGWRYTPPGKIPPKKPTYALPKPYPPKPSAPPIQPIHETHGVRTDTVDCEYGNRCKHYGDLCRNCKKNKRLRTESFYEPINITL